MYKNIVNFISNIIDNESFTENKKKIDELIDNLKINENFNKIRIIVLYCKYPEIIYYMNKNNVNFNCLDKYGKNLLFYTIILRYHCITDILLSIGLKIQKKYVHNYINFLLLPNVGYNSKRKENYNANLLLKVIYCYGYTIEDINDILDKNSLAVDNFNKFKNNFKNEIIINLKYYQLWNRRKNLAFIMNDYYLSNNYVGIFNYKNGITDIIKSYL